jgi:hypothetical protein
MLRFIAGVIAGTELVTGLLVALLAQCRAKFSRRRAAKCLNPTQPALPNATSTSASGNNDSASVSAEFRAVAYREILDALGEDIDADIADWEAVLQEFPQVIGTSELCEDDGRIVEKIVETENDPSAVPTQLTRESVAPLSRTRKLSAEEQSLILRLLHSDFASEEVALWLNLPLERVQEVQIRGGLT